MDQITNITKIKKRKIDITFCEHTTFLHHVTQNRKYQKYCLASSLTISCDFNKQSSLHLDHDLICQKGDWVNVSIWAISTCMLLCTNKNTYFLDVTWWFLFVNHKYTFLTKLEPIWCLLILMPVRLFDTPCMIKWVDGETVGFKPTENIFQYLNAVFPGFGKVTFIIKV